MHYMKDSKPLINKNMTETNCESYPPIFRPNHNNIPNHEPYQKVSDFDPLPVIDFNNIDHENLSQACRDLGMFRLINHGIPLTLLGKLLDQSQKLFSLSFESKQALFCTSPPMAYFWGTPGLTPSGVPVQRESGSKHHGQSFNWIEGFHVLLTPLSQCKFQDLMLDSFRDLLEEYGNHQTRLAETVYEALAMNLQLDPSKTKSYMSPETGHLRVHRYPCCLDADQAWGINVHTDSSLLSILYEDQVGGLQVLNKDHQWLDVKPVSDSLIVNLGDMMQAMSDDIFVAAKHRVKVNKRKERISIGYFVFPYEDAVIESSKYKPFTYPDFRAEVQQDLKTIGSKIGLPKFKLDQTF